MMHAILSCAVALAALPADASDNDGNTASIKFTLPFQEALAASKADNRLMFFKPVYGGVDEAGAKDYRTGSW